MSAPTVVLANSETLTRRGLEALVRQGGGVGSLVHCETDEELRTAFDEQSVDLLIIDYNQQGFFSIDSVKRVKSRNQNQKVLVISTDPSLANTIEALEMGVEGYLTRQCSEDEIVHAIFAVLGGEKFFCNKILNIILNRSFAKTEVDEEPDCAPTNLTRRETQVTTLIAQGKTTQNIADELTLSYHTVHTHRKNIMRKLNAHSTSDLVLYSVRMGLIDSGASLTE